MWVALSGEYSWQVPDCSKSEGEKGIKSQIFYIRPTDCLGRSEIAATKRWLRWIAKFHS
jgi:hypothetical protein